MRTFLFIFLFIWATLSATSQRCACSKNLEFAISKMEHNYAGFQDKVTSSTRPSYQTHTDSLRIQAESVRSDSACMRLCLKWLRWFKDNHITMAPYGASQMLRGLPPAFALTELDSQTTLLHLPSMSGNYTALVDSMLQANEMLLRRNPFLIVDCRNNSGGSDQTWASLKTYLYTQPTVTDGRQYWASEDNAGYLLEIAKKKDTSKKTRRYLKSVAAEMKKHPGKFVGTMNAVRGRPSAVLPHPRKVVILVNNRSASSTENLILWAKQSKKVTVMGTTTAGVADYGNAGVSVAPCRDWELWIPMMRSNRVAAGRAIDNVGIVPDVVLDEPESDWITRAKEHFKK